MTTYSSEDVTVTIATKDVSAYVDKINGVNLTKVSEEVSPMGSAALYDMAAGIDKVEDIVIEGVLDDTADKAWDVLYDQRGAAVTLALDYGPITRTVSALVVSCDPVIHEGGLTWYKAVLKNASATITEA